MLKTVKMCVKVIEESNPKVVFQVQIFHLLNLGCEQISRLFEPVSHVTVLSLTAAVAL